MHENQYLLLMGTIYLLLIWGRVFDRAGKGFVFSGDIFTPETAILVLFTMAFICQETLKVLLLQNVVKILKSSRCVIRLRKDFDLFSRFLTLKLDRRYAKSS